MANRERGELGLVCEGQSYTLRLTVAMCCELEDQTGLSFDALTQRVNKGRVKDLRWLLWGALQAHHADAFTTPEVVGDIIDGLGGARAAQRVLSEFLRLNSDESTDVRPVKSGKAPSPEPGSTWRRLYLDARGVGVSGEQFWQLSLKELWLEMAAARRQVKRDRDRDITVAWYTAALAWASPRPSLESLLRANEPPRKQTPEEQRLVLETLSNQLGIPLKRVPKTH